MNFCSYSPDSHGPGTFEDGVTVWDADALTKLDERYSFSVVYRMNDFPFPSIHYPTDDTNLSESVLQPEFSGSLESVARGCDWSSCSYLGMCSPVTQ
jgi:hypothetical protein